MLSQPVRFMPLGGGQTVGASCYYLRLGSSNIILDAGLGIRNRTVFGPDFYPLLTSRDVESLGQINQIYISHAHTDHVGYLPNLMTSATHADVFMTKPTRLLSRYQLLDHKYRDSSFRQDNCQIAADHLFDRIVDVSYSQTLYMPDYQVTFFPAGHIPGAMMMLFRYQGRNILYTGDYSIHPTPLTYGCVLPEDLKVDTLILCGLHARHPNYHSFQNTLAYSVESVLRQARFGCNPVCHFSQLSKGIEFLKLLNDRNSDHVPVYIDNAILQIVQIMERLSIPILTGDNYVTGSNSCRSRGEGITLVMGRDHVPDCQNEKEISFTLHEDFDEMREFIRRLNPRQAIIVHTAPAQSINDDTIEQIIMREENCQTQFIFAEDQQCYIL